MRQQNISPYHFRVDNDLKTVWIEHSGEVEIELVELVDGASGANVPEHTVTEHEVIAGIERCAVPRVVVCERFVVEGRHELTRGQVIDLHEQSRERCCLLLHENMLTLCLNKA